MKPVPLGIDIAKATFEAALLLDASHALRAQFPNCPTGFRRLGRWLKAHAVARVRLAVEATSTYAEALLEWAYQAGHEAFLLNPERVAQYARSLGRRNKTDQVDAVTIGAFIATHEATAWRPPTPEQKNLRSLTRTRYQLVQLRTQLANQLRTAHPAGAVFLRATLCSIEEQLVAVDQAITAHLRQHRSLEEAVRRLRTLKGVGLITAATLIAELPAIDRHTDPRTIAAWAGLTPCRRQSGQSEWRTHLSRKGNAFVRHALYMPAMVAKRFNPLLRAFAQRLADQQKSKGAILGAVAHKMLRILVALLRSNTDFDPNWSYQKT